MNGRVMPVVGSSPRLTPIWTRAATTIIAVSPTASRNPNVSGALRAIRPHLDGKQIEYLGLLSQEELGPYYRKAAALLVLINWCEPFGLTAAEAQA